MKIKIQTPGFTVQQGLINFVHKKIKKLCCFYKEIIACEVCLRLDTSNAKDGKLCSVKLLVPGN